MEDVKDELEVLAAAAMKIDEVLRAVQHYVETDNLRFAALALQMGEQSVDDLARRYRRLLKHIGEPSNPG